MAETLQMKEVLSSRRWVRQTRPFPFVVAEDVFVPDVAQALSEQVVKIFESQQKVTHFGFYDAWSWTFTYEQAWPLSIFISPEFCDLIAKVAGVKRNGYVSGGLHHHKVGSARGWVHSDFSRVWFTEPSSGPDDITLPRNDLLGHMTGEVFKKGVTPYTAVRGVALLYYTGNEEWRPGDGGETGLYLRASDPVERPSAKVPPKNNSLVIFECTPSSFHAFLSNRRIERNSVVMWVHRDESDAIARWGDRSFAGAPGGRAVRQN